MLCVESRPHGPHHRPNAQGSGGGAVSDQWIEPFVMLDERGEPVGTIEDGDAVVVFNFRADRVVEISKAFEYEDFPYFDRQRFPKVCKKSKVQLHIGAECGDRACGLAA